MQQIFSFIFNANICRIIKATSPLLLNIKILLIFILVLNSCYHVTGALQVAQRVSMALCKAVCHYEIFLWVSREKKNKKERKRKLVCLRESFQMVELDQIEMYFFLNDKKVKGCLNL